MNKDNIAQIPWASPALWGNEEGMVLEALKSTWISGGPYVERFEQELSVILGTKYTCAVMNGTAALHAAYLGLQLRPGDEIVVPGFAFMGAANIALHVGAVPVFVEVDPDTWCITAESIESRLSSRTKAIVAIHTYGNVCDMDSILALANKKNIPVIEDAAESFASRYNGRYSGTLGTIGIYSFHATKTITTGEGGMVATNVKELADRISLYRSHGLLRKRHYWHELPGHNFRLTNLQAALGCAQLEKLGTIVRERERVHARYQARLARIAGIVPQRFSPRVNPVIWAIAVKLDPAAFPQGRDAAMAQMQEAGIETRPGFYAASMMPHNYSCSKLPVCENLSQQVISLPTFSTLTDEQIELICDRLESLRR